MKQKRLWMQTAILTICVSATLSLVACSKDLLKKLLFCKQYLQNNMRMINVN